MWLSALIYSITYNWSLPFCHCAFPSHTGCNCISTVRWVKRLGMRFLPLTHLQCLWWAAVRKSFARRGWLMMFWGRVGPPTTESPTHNRGGLIDRLRSWKLQTKGLYGNVCRIKILHSLQSSLPIIMEQVSRQEERRHENLVLDPSNSHYCHELCKNTLTY